MITSAMQTDEIKIQAKAERNVERKLLLNEERKTDATVKKDNFEGNDDLVVSRKTFNNTHGNDKKKSTAKYNKTKNNIVKGKKKVNKNSYVSIYKNSWKKNLKMVDVRRDGNYFSRAIAHQLFFNESHHEQVRQSAVKEVIENPERYENFVTEGLDEYVAILPTNREWANNTAIQETANALGISIEIINDSERLPS